MCGLFGMMGPGIIKKDFEIFRHLGFISMIRGVDAAGVFETNTRWANKKSKWSPDEMKKVGGDFSYLLYLIDTDRKCNLLSDVSHDLVMGHVRWSTRGANTDENAHPFLPGNLVGFHNGTLNDPQYTLDKNKTDSEALFEHISREGLIDVLPALKVENNSYAIAMYDRASKVVYFARNEKRPLFFAINENRSVMYYASEPWFLTCALGRQGEKFSKPFALKPNLIAAVRPNDVRAGVDKIFHIVWNKENVDKMMEKIAEEVSKKVETEAVKKKEEIVPPRTLPSPYKKAQATKIYQVREKEDDKVVDLYVKCNCGKHRLGVFDSYMLKKSGNYSTAVASTLVYDRISGTFECPMPGDNTEVKQ